MPGSVLDWQEAYFRTPTGRPRKGSIYNLSDSMLHHAEFEQWLPVDVNKVFLFFCNPGNLPRIMPPKTKTEFLRIDLVPPPGFATPGPTVTDDTPIAGAGSRIVTSFRVVPFLPFRPVWIARIVEFEWNRFFVDVQEKGPFKSFRHRHEVIHESRNGVTGSIARDVVDYEVGFGFLGEFAQRLTIRHQLQSMFQYRQQAVVRLLSK